MESTQLLILQFIAHLLSDYYFQSEKKAKEKNYKGFRSRNIKMHVIITFGISWILSFQPLFVIGSVLIAVTHWLTDGMKKYILAHKSLGRHAFYLDQLLHLLLILITVSLFDHYIGYEPLLILPFDIKTLVIASAYLICAKPANILVREIFVSSDIIELDRSGELPNAGKLIGTVERMLTLTFILLGQFEAVGFLIAAKSILRYKDNSDIKSEYVLIGTLLSFGIAVTLGVIINLIFAKGPV